MENWIKKESESLAARFSGVNRAAFAREQEVPGGQNMIYQHITGRRPISLDAAKCYAKGFGVPLREISQRLADDIDDAVSLSGRNEEEATSLSGFTPLPNKKHLVTIARYDTGGAMGDGVVLHDEAGVIESWEVSKKWVTANLRNYTSAENLCIVTGFGDSMRPTYNPGDPLIVDKGVKTVEFDSVYFFRIDNHGYVKRLQRIPTTSGLLLRALSDNKDTYDAFDITSDMNFQVLGRVIQVWRREDF